MTERDELRAECIEAMADALSHYIPTPGTELNWYTQAARAFDSLHGVVNVSHVHWKFWRLLITSRDLTNAPEKKP